MAQALTSPLPRDYVRRTLARLLPAPEEVATMSAAQILKLKDKKDELQRLIERDPVRFFQPHEQGGQKPFMSHDDPRTRVLMLIAGNKHGKTAGGAIKFGERLYGSALWGLETRGHLKYPVPARGVVFAEDFDSHKEVTLPNILNWWPKSFIRQIKRNPAGHVTEIGCANGSVVYFRTYDQGPEKAAGKDWDILWFDEPPPRSVWVEARRGIVATNGVCLLTATLVTEAWLFDEVEVAHTVCFQGTIYDNLWLNRQARDDYLASLDDDERDVRASGQPASLSGLVYKGFKDDAPWIVPHTLPLDVPIFMGVDPHEQRGVYCLWGYLTPHDRIVWFDWLITRAKDLTGLFTEIEDVIREHPRRPAIVLMDPNRGKTPQMGGTCWQDEFEARGFSVLLGEDDRKSGHAKVQEYLRYEVDDATNEILVPPRMIFTDHCRGKAGPVWQMLRYAWDDKKSRRDRDPKEIPKEIHKDFPDVIRYAAKAELTFDALWRGPEVVDIRPARWLERRTTQLACA